MDQTYQAISFVSQLHLFGKMGIGRLQHPNLLPKGNVRDDIEGEVAKPLERIDSRVGRIEFFQPEQEFLEMSPNNRFHF